ncbi:hypothetical protein SAMN05421820_113109 [Pedobacter steynii]|uniref:Uncharacterized protein n=1 Tax=Pedobacter steynii TaxID=430522 RepID=A0A1H0IC83_9SPHI|nr:hypothetical protein [Pedobacter steynii]NQX42859.1 hypothetical protein [Pedobacter steynii]SDO28975.1 hypothetical protein SAMN05421820_113109 [Pedobacter steynii]
MRSRKEKMPVFIQAMYGTVIGLSFFQLALKTPAELDMIGSGHILTNFLTSSSFFRLLFLILTILMVAQEWVAQEQTKKAKRPLYWHYIPQFLALFCLSQMFAALETLQLKYWYANALGYTLCNVLGFFLSNKEAHKTTNTLQYLRYLIQVFLLEIFFFIIPADFIWPFHLIAFLVSAYVLVFIWWLCKVLTLYFQLKDSPYQSNPS